MKKLNSIKKTLEEDLRPPIHIHTKTHDSIYPKNEDLHVEIETLKAEIKRCHQSLESSLKNNQKLNREKEEIQDEKKNIHRLLRKTVELDPNLNNHAHESDFQKLEQIIKRMNEYKGLYLEHMQNDNKTSNDAMKCCVCLEKPIDSFFFPCGHPICHECGKKILIDVKPTCPHCRQNIISLRKLYIQTESTQHSPSNPGNGFVNDLILNSQQHPKLKKKKTGWLSFFGQ